MNSFIFNSNDSLKNYSDYFQLVKRLENDVNETLAF